MCCGVGILQVQRDADGVRADGIWEDPHNGVHGRLLCHRRVRCPVLPCVALRCIGSPLFFFPLFLLLLTVFFWICVGSPGVPDIAVAPAKCRYSSGSNDGLMSRVIDDVFDRTRADTDYKVPPPPAACCGQAHLDQQELT